MRGSKHNDATRAKAKALLAQGLSAEEVGVRIGVPRPTIWDWQLAWRDDEEFINLRLKNDIELQDTFRRIQTKALIALESKIDAGEVNAATLNIVAGTTFDKQQLLRGGNTANIGVNGIEAILKKAEAEGGKEF